MSVIAKRFIALIVLTISLILSTDLQHTGNMSLTPIGVGIFFAIGLGLNILVIISSLYLLISGADRYKWMHVDQKYPEDNKPCLVQYHNGVMCYGKFVSGVFHAWDYQNQNFFETSVATGGLGIVKYHFVDLS